MDQFAIFKVQVYVTVVVDMLKASGKMLTQIAEQLNLAGFKTPRGREFHLMQVRRLYLRPASIKQIFN
ncbi:hypothetical protein [Spirosoma arcticum]